MECHVYFEEELLVHRLYELDQLKSMTISDIKHFGATIKQLQSKITTWGGVGLEDVLIGALHDPMGATYILSRSGVSQFELDKQIGPPNLMRYGRLMRCSCVFAEGHWLVSDMVPETSHLVK
jgi:hypothetical protein